MGTAESKTSMPQHPGGQNQGPPDLMFFLGRWEAKLDVALERLQRHEEGTEQLARRVQHLEQDKARLFGMVTAVAAVCSLIFNYFDPLERL
ncbi:MAG: hypothetical protein J7D61_07815 [Marichromatium sp.]|nr:hypothetical protein [Marichromatium sp.]